MASHQSRYGLFDYCYIVLYTSCLQKIGMCRSAQSSSYIREKEGLDDSIDMGKQNGANVYIF